MLRYPDTPRRVSVEFLRRLDTEVPGRWHAQRKIDGVRRVAWLADGKWTYYSKHLVGPAAMPMPNTLVAEFESLPWPDGIGLDMEWSGRRCVQFITEHKLHLFDLLMAPVGITKQCRSSANGDCWLGDVPFSTRYELLRQLVEAVKMAATSPSNHIHLIPCWTNPGLVDRFLEQIQDPLSEGLVVRRADSGLVGHTGRFAENPMWFKIKHRDDVPSGLDAGRRKGGAQ
ncbi:MAG TPA: hypothetical protein VGP72_05205 [Planctomycetota bacterium]|jgi:hypothetical protein